LNRCQSDASCKCKISLAPSDQTSRRPDLWSSQKHFNIVPQYQSVKIDIAFIMM